MQLPYEAQNKNNQRVEKLQSGTCFKKVDSGVMNDYHDSIEYLKEMLTSKNETIEQQKQIIKIQADEILTLKV